MSVTELDYMEYSSDAAAQAAYVSNGAESADQSQTEKDRSEVFGDVGGVEYRIAQGFQLSGDLTVSAVEVGRNAGTVGTPSGNWTLRIETNNGGYPSGTLADANASVVVTPPAEGAAVKGTFTTSFSLSGSTTYWLVFVCDNQATDNSWRLSATNTNPYANGVSVVSDNGGSTWGDWGPDQYFKIYKAAVLQSYSEATIKTQGSYALKAVATTGALNKTLTRTIT